MCGRHVSRITLRRISCGEPTVPELAPWSATWVEALEAEFDEGTGTSGTPTALRTEDGAEPGVQEVPVPLRLAAERQSNRDIRCNDDYLEHCSRFGGP